MGDTVITTKGNSLGRLGFVSSAVAGAVYSPHLSYWRSLDHKKIEPRWLYYWARSDLCMPQVRSMSHSTDMAPYLSLRDQLRFEIELPPFAEQRAIAEVLGALDDKIEANRRMNATLEALARALFKSWFVDFDPVRAKLEGRTPELAPDLAALFPARLTESALGLIPEGWGVGDLSTFAGLNPESWSRTNYPDEIEYVDLANTKWGEINEIQRFERSEAPSRAQRILREGDTIVGTVRPGNGAYALVDRDGLTGSTGFAALRPSGKDNREFVYLRATDPDAIDLLAHLADGGAYPAVRPKAVIELETIVPNNRLITAFSALAGPWLDRIAAGRNHSRTLAQLRDLLLPKLLSGALRVRDAERMIGDAA